MSIANPLTASSEIQVAFIGKTEGRAKEIPLKPDLGPYARDVVNISTLGIEKQQKEIQVEATRQIDNIANEVIRLSSSIGKARSVGNLTHSQATTLYKQIANLL